MAIVRCVAAALFFLIGIVFADIYNDRRVWIGALCFVLAALLLVWR